MSKQKQSLVGVDVVLEGAAENPPLHNIAIKEYKELGTHLE